MALQKFKREIAGISPLVLHNGDLANRHYAWNKLLKPLQARRQKTDAEYEEIERLEFLGGLYWNGKNLYLPVKMIKKTILNAAKKTKAGEKVRTGVFVTADALLKYRGPQTPEELWQDERFRYSDMVVVSGRRILRMRPKFTEWGADIMLLYDDTICNLAQVDAWLVTAGQVVGFGEQRPDKGGAMGMFKVVG